MSNKDPLSRQLILDFPSQPEYSFSNFIVSDGSKIAFDAARQFCSDSSSFNTLYFFGSKKIVIILFLSINGDLLTVNFSFLVGRGIGPLTLAPVLLAVFIISGAFYSKVVRNHVYEKTQVENIAMFKSTVTLGSLVWLNFSNLIILICSVGLALPYVKIRRSLYFCQVTHVTILSGMEDVIADQSTDASSVGDEVSEIFDFDVAIG